MQQPKLLQQPGQIVSSSPHLLLVEIVTRFLTRILENDSKASSYLKEWNSFKELLLKEPLNLDPIFLHIASIQLTKDLIAKSDPTPSRVSIPGVLNINLPGKQVINTSRPSLETKTASSIAKGSKTPTKENEIIKEISPSQSDPKQVSTQQNKQNIQIQQCQTPQAKSPTANLEKNNTLILPTMPSTTSNANLQIKKTMTHHYTPSADIEAILQRYTRPSTTKNDPKKIITTFAQILDTAPEMKLPERKRQDKPGLGLLEKAKKFKNRINGNTEKLIEDFAEARSTALKDTVDQRTVLKRVAVYSRESSVKDLGSVIENTQENTFAKQLPGGEVIIRY